MSFIIWRCEIKKIKFGTDAMYKAGNKMLTECADYLDRLPENAEIVAPKEVKRHKGLERCKEVLRK